MRVSEKTGARRASVEFAVFAGVSAVAIALSVVAAVAIVQYVVVPSAMFAVAILAPRRRWPGPDERKPSEGVSATHGG